VPERESISAIKSVNDAQLDRFRSGELNSHSVLDAEGLRDLAKVFTGRDLDHVERGFGSAGDMSISVSGRNDISPTEFQVRLRHHEGEAVFFVRVEDGAFVMQGQETEWKLPTIIDQVLAAGDAFDRKLANSVVVDDFIDRLDHPDSETISFAIQEPELAELLKKVALMQSENYLFLTDEEQSAFQQGCMRIVCDKAALLGLCLYLRLETANTPDLEPPEFEEVERVLRDGFEGTDPSAIYAMLYDFNSVCRLFGGVWDALTFDDSPWSPYLENESGQDITGVGDFLDEQKRKILDIINEPDEE